MSYVIGLTGNIATGKSAVLHMLRELGALVIDADAVTRHVMAADQPAHAQIVAEFGPTIVQPDGEIDRAALGRRVFGNPAALQRLEQIVHPATIARVEQAIADAQAPVVVIEAIKLIESGMVRRLCHTLWVVTAPEEQQLARLQKQRGMRLEDALLRVHAQPPQEEKARLADVVIDNAGSLEDTRQQVLAAWERIPLQRRNGAAAE